MLNRCPRALPPLPDILAAIGRPGPAALARALGVSVRTVARWLSRGRAPRAAALALWWLTPEGLSVLDAEAVNAARLHAAHAAALAAELARLRRDVAALELGAAGAANAPVFDPGRPRPPRFSARAS